VLKTISPIESKEIPIWDFGKVFGMCMAIKMEATKTSTL